MTFTATAQSLTSDDDKPNEDWYAVTDDLVIVLDGATIRTDTGCIHGLPWFTHQLGAAIIAAAQSTSVPLADVLAGAIRQIRDLHSGTCDLTHPGTPSAAVGIVRNTGERLEWLTLGDITVMVQTADGIDVTCDNRVSKVAVPERRECDRHLLGTEAKMAAIQAMKPLELAARNTDGGYWIASVVPEAAQHAYTGSALLTAVEQVGVCSDGAMRALDHTNLTTHASVMSTLRAGGPAMLIEQVRQAERHDPEGRRVPRNKATDDATAVYLGAVKTKHRAPTRDEQEAAIALMPSTTGLFGAIPTADGRVI